MGAADSKNEAANLGSDDRKSRRGERDFLPFHRRNGVILRCEPLAASLEGYDCGGAAILRDARKSALLRMTIARV
jgi:hypothetical protein